MDRELSSIILNSYEIHNKCYLCNYKKGEEKLEFQLNNCSFTKTINLNVIIGKIKIFL